MTFLYVVIGIIIFFIIVLSIRASILIEYGEYVTLKVKWLFLKFNLLPLTSKQQKKRAETKQRKKEKEIEKKAKADAKAEAKRKSKPEPEPEVKPQTSEAAAEEKTAPAQKKDAKKPSLLKELWKAHGYDGLVKMLKDTVNALNTFFGNAVRSVVINELYYTMRVSKEDAAQTAIEYGKICAELYPLFGTIVTTLKTEKYDVEIYPDYLASKSKMFLHIKLLVCPRKIINAALGLSFRLLFKVVLKVLVKLFKKPKKQSKIKEKNKNKGGALV